MSHDIQQMVAMEMRNDNILLEWNSNISIYGIARQGVDKLDRHIAGAHVKNPPGAIAAHGDNIRTQRLVRNLQILDSIGKLNNSWHDAKNRKSPFITVILTPEPGKKC